MAGLQYATEDELEDEKFSVKVKILTSLED